MREVVEFDYDSIARALDSLPPVNQSRKKEPTDAQKRALLKYWPSGKNQKEIAKILGVCDGTARRWYREALEELE